VTCRVLGFSKQAFYQWKAERVSDRDHDDAHLLNAAVDIHHAAVSGGLVLPSNGCETAEARPVEHEGLCMGRGRERFDSKNDDLVIASRELVVDR